MHEMQAIVPDDPVDWCVSVSLPVSHKPAPVRLPVAAEQDRGPDWGEGSWGPKEHCMTHSSDGATFDEPLLDYFSYLFGHVGAGGES